MKRWVLLLLMVLVGVMGSAGAHLPAPLADRNDPALMAAAGTIHTHAAQHRLLVLGELHGTREIPALVAHLLQRYAALGAVTLALEMPHTEQAALDAYLASAGTPQDWRRLASTPFWQVVDDQHDGRRSVQMRQLIEAVRALRADGASVNVLAYDVSKIDADAHDHHWRDLRMADQLRAAIERAPGTLVVLTGNVHAMRVRPSWAPPELQLAPMTSRLLDLKPYSVNLTGASGQFWGCPKPAACRAVDAHSWQGGEDLRVDNAPDRAYDLWLRLPVLTVADLLEAQD